MNTNCIYCTLDLKNKILKTTQIRTVFGFEEFNVCIFCFDIYERHMIGMHYEPDPQDEYLDSLANQDSICNFELLHAIPQSPLENIKAENSDSFLDTLIKADKISDSLNSSFVNINEISYT